MRDGCIYIIIGGRGTGKTTYLENILQKCAENTLICELFQTARYENFENRITYDEIKLKDCVNKKIVMDDCTQYVMGGGNLLLRKLVVSSKQLGSDVFLVFHSFNFVPPFIWALFDYIIAFPAEKVRKTASLSPYFEKINKIQSKKGVKYKPIGIIEKV